MTGGHYGDERGIKDVIQYNCLENACSEMVNMLTGRCHHSCFYSEGCVYIFGGVDEYGYYTRKCEKFPLVVRTGWKHIKNISSPRANISVIEICQKMYLIGGYDGTV